MEKILDLGRIARELPTGSKHGERFKSAVRSAIGAQAELNDLQVCQAALAAIAEIDALSGPMAGEERVEQNARHAAYGSALYLQAIVLYIRATERRSDRHKPLPEYEGAYSEDLKVKHNQMMKLRNDAIAHWGPGPRLGGGAHHDFTIAMKGEVVRIPFNVSNYTARVVHDLAELAAAAIPVAAQKVNNTLEKLPGLYRALMAAEPDTPQFELGDYSVDFMAGSKTFGSAREQPRS